jgi:hypothetical protein
MGGHGFVERVVPSLMIMEETCGLLSFAGLPKSRRPARGAAAVGDCRGA